MIPHDTTLWAVAIKSMIAGRGQVLVPVEAHLRIRTYRRIGKVFMFNIDHTSRINPFQVPLDEIALLLDQGYWRLFTPMELLTLSAEKTEQD